MIRRPHVPGTPRRRAGRDGRWAFLGLILVLTLVYIANLFGPPPPGQTEIAVAALGLWLFVAWGYWVDRHRPPAPHPARPGATGPARTD